MIEHELELELHKSLERVSAPVIVRANDNQSQKITARIYKDGEPYNVEGSHVRLDILREDGTFARIEGKAEGKRATCVLPQGALKASKTAGIGYFVLTKDNESATTENFYFRVERGATDTDQSDKYFDTAVNQIVEKWKALTFAAEQQEAKREEAETARKQAESTRQEQENTREGAEAKRAKAFEQAQTQRAQEHNQAQTQRAQDFTDAQDKRAREFTEAQDKRAQAFTQAENTRSEAFASSQASQGQAFTSAQDKRAQEHEQAQNKRAQEYEQAKAQRAQEHESQYQAYAEQLKQFSTAEEARKEAESARASSEQERISSESARKEAESKRTQAESARAESETRRQENEQVRESTERGRMSEEATRRDQEKECQAQEVVRTSQEASRVASFKQMIDACQNLKFKILQDAEIKDGEPAIVGVAGIIYLVKSKDATKDNAYTEWIYYDGKWELFGSTAPTADPIPTEKIEACLTGQEISGNLVLDATGLSRYTRALEAKYQTLEDAHTQLQALSEADKAQVQALQTAKQEQAQALNEAKSALESKINSAQSALESKLSNTQSTLESKLSESATALKAQISTQTDEIKATRAYADQVATSTKTEANKAIETLRADVEKKAGEDELTQATETLNNAIEKRATTEAVDALKSELLRTIEEARKEGFKKGTSEGFAKGLEEGKTSPGVIKVDKKLISLFGAPVYMRALIENIEPKPLEGILRVMAKEHTNVGQDTYSERYDEKEQLKWVTYITDLSAFYCIGCRKQPAKFGDSKYPLPVTLGSYTEGYRLFWEKATRGLKSADKDTLMMFMGFLDEGEPYNNPFSMWFVLGTGEFFQALINKLDNDTVKALINKLDNDAAKSLINKLDNDTVKALINKLDNDTLRRLDYRKEPPYAYLMGRSVYVGY